LREWSDKWDDHYEGTLQPRVPVELDMTAVDWNLIPRTRQMSFEVDLIQSVGGTETVEFAVLAEVI